jgi:SpoU rRNA methylase family enzyme
MLKGMVFRKGRHAFSHLERRFFHPCPRSAPCGTGFSEKVAGRCKLLFAGVNTGLQGVEINYRAILRYSDVF